MLTLNTLRVPLDQFRTDTYGSGRTTRWGQVAALVPALVVGVLAFFNGTAVNASGAGILTAMSLLTGFTFAMALTFWNKAIDSRRDPAFVADGATLRFLDTMRNHLIYTVSIGCLVTALSILQAVFTGPAPWPGLTSAAISGLAIYLVTLVLLALKRFNEAFFLLKP